MDRRRVGSLTVSLVGLGCSNLGVDDRRGAKPEYVHQAIEDSLRRLGTECIDLYHLHQPDLDTPIADTLQTLDGLMRAGIVRKIGCSNFSAGQLRAAQQTVRPGAAPFVSVQNEYGLLHREAEEAAIPGCLRAGLTFISYFPPASGLLTDIYRRAQLAGSGLAFRFGSERLTVDNRILRRHEDIPSSIWPCPGRPRGPPRIGIAVATSP